jgi:hypothetical protein
VNSGPDLGEEVAHVITGGTAGELIEHVAEVRPHVEVVPGRTGADAQQYRGRLQARVARDMQQFFRPTASGRMVRSAVALSIVRRPSVR